jgi:hypothetical protein
MAQSTRMDALDIYMGLQIMMIDILNINTKA